MLWSQTILFGLWGGLFAGEGRFSDIIDYSVLKFFEGLLCVAGAIAAYGSYRSVDAATQEIERIKCLYEKTKRRFGYAKAPEDEIFGMVVGKDIYHKSGHIVTHYGPVFFILVWLLMLFVFVLKPWIWKLTPIPNIIYQGPGAGP